MLENFTRNGITILGDYKAVQYGNTHRGFQSYNVFNTLCISAEDNGKTM